MIIFITNPDPKVNSAKWSFSRDLYKMESKPANHMGQVEICLNPYFVF